MTLITPILSNITTFDPACDTEISFSYSGGQIERKHIVIMDATTSVGVYESTQVGMQLAFTIPAHSLQVGQYLAQVQVYDFNGNSSEMSSPVLFYCYSTPRLTFAGLDKENVNTLNMANITLTSIYTQAENDRLIESAYYLYDQNKTLISKSDTMYTLSSYTFYGLQNFRTYYVRCVGKTTHGMSADTGFVEIVVNYIVRTNNVLIDVQNNRWDGYISIDCNIIDVGYTETGEYEIIDGILKLPPGSSIAYDSGIQIDNTFTLLVKARNIPTEKNFLELKVPDGNVGLSVKNLAGDYYGTLTAQTALDNYILYVKMPRANIIDTNGNALGDENNNYIVDTEYNSGYMMVFDIRKKGNLYSLQIYYEDNGTIVV